MEKYQDAECGVTQFGTLRGEMRDLQMAIENARVSVRALADAESAIDSLCNKLTSLDRPHVDKVISEKNIQLKFENSILKKQIQELKNTYLLHSAEIRMLKKELSIRNREIKKIRNS
tara:strand:- start:816 stop:1166 length:351 start_codon:yes stop_codon:yes gene_type:complete